MCCLKSCLVSKVPSAAQAPLLSPTAVAGTLLCLFSSCIPEHTMQLPRNTQAGACLSEAGFQYNSSNFDKFFLSRFLCAWSKRAFQRARKMLSNSLFPDPCSLETGPCQPLTCRALQQPNKAVCSIPPPCLSCYHQILANASGFCFLWLFYTYMPCQHWIPTADLARSFLEEAAHVAWNLGEEELALSISFLPVPRHSRCSSLLCFSRQCWKAMKKDFGVTTRQFCKYVLALTLSTSHKWGELSEDQNQTWPCAVQLKSLQVYRKHLPLPLQQIAGLYLGSVFFSKALFTRQICSCVHISNHSQWLQHLDPQLWSFLF